MTLQHTYHPESFTSSLQWDSHEDLLPLFRVCAAWRDALEHVLFESVRVIGERAADRFLDRVQSRPELGQLVRRLVVGLERGGNGEDAHALNGQGLVSRKLVEVIRACPQVRQIQVRPLHHSVGEDLTRLLATLPLRTLAIGPRLENAHTAWTGPLFSTSTLPVSHPSVAELEIDTWVDNVLLQLPLPDFPVSPLRHLCIQDIHIPTEVFAAIVSHAPQLEFLEVYSEHVFDVEPVQRALEACKDSLREITFLANPVSYLPTSSDGVHRGADVNVTSTERRRAPPVRGPRNSTPDGPLPASLVRSPASLRQRVRNQHQPVHPHPALPQAPQDSGLQCE